MRWASNKRLHFELGVIAAVQSLNEVSISDVIEALDSGSGAGLPKPAPRPQTAPPPLRRAAAPVMRETEPVKVLEESRSEAPVARSEAPVSNLRAAIAAAEPAPAPGAQPAPAPQRQPETAPVEPPSAATVSTADFWPKLVQTVQERRPLAVSWLQVASLLGITGRTVKVGFPTTEGFARESLMRPAQLGFLESLAQELLGQPVKLELVLDASLKAPEFTEMGLGLLDEPPPPPKPKIELKPEPKPEMKAEAKPAVAATPAAPEAAKVDPEFYNDPLIRKAMEKFKAKLVPAG